MDRKILNIAVIGAGSIEAGKVYDVFVPYWELEVETTDENTTIEN